MSQEIDDFKTVVLGFLENIAADIQRLIDNSTGLSQQDKDTLQAIASRAAEVANIVPEP